MNAGEVGATLALDNVPSIGIDKTIMPERLRLSMAALVVTIMALAFLGGTTARYGIPILTTGAAYLLYRRAPVVYVSFVWWLFFLICLLRRVIDYRSGFSEQNVIVAAPFLASLVCLPTMLSRSDIWRLRTSLPFVLALSSSLYGFGVGALCLPKKTLLVSTLAWFSPLVFGFFLMCELRHRVIIS